MKARALGLCSMIALAMFELGCGAVTARSPSSASLSPSAKRLPARVRRLTNVEYERTVNELLGLKLELTPRLPPDVRQEGYTENIHQVVPAAWAARLDALARDAAHEAVEKRLQKLVPCQGPATLACYQDAILQIGARAFRRPLEEAEREALRGVLAEGPDLRAQFELVIAALLQSPSLLYLTELGPPRAAKGQRVKLEPYEIASLLSYTTRGGPPDEELLAAAQSGALLEPEEREKQARRLISQSDTRYHVRRFVLEWLEVDGLEATAKSPAQYPEYERLRPLMLAETSAFIDEVMVHEGASISALLDGGFASVEPPLARFYGLSTYGPRASLQGPRRRGLLQQASFLSAHAHEDVSSPVKRGDFVLRKVLCQRVPRAGEIGIDLVMPPPSTTLTTRERFRAHAEDGSCAACHKTMDALGFAFEGFDAMGRARASEHGKPIDTRGQAALGGERSITFADSLELTRKLAGSPEVAECFARQGFRFFSAQVDPAVEEGYIQQWRGLEGAARGSLIESLVAYVKSDLFVEREVPR